MPVGLGVLTPEHPQCWAILESIVNLHASCIINDGTMATFIPPLSQKRMREKWTQFLDEAASGSRIIIISIANIRDRGVPPYIIDFPFNMRDWPVLSSTEEVSGTVSLCLPQSETGPFRGLVQNLFVSPHHRRRGIALRLLAELERQALGQGRWSLMLDTTEGTEAENLYTDLEWQRMGTVKDYGLSPKTGAYVNEVFFWKDIRKARNE